MLLQKLGLIRGFRKVSSRKGRNPATRLLAVILILGGAICLCASSADAAMLIPTTRVGSSDWGSGETVEQLFDGTPTVEAGRRCVERSEPAGNRRGAIPDVDDELPMSCLDFQSVQ
ncbi:MAG: hypothetical protein WCJ35_19780 [Planctomycetota bacterium]